MRVGISLAAVAAVTLAATARAQTLSPAARAAGADLALHVERLAAGYAGLRVLASCPAGLYDRASVDRLTRRVSLRLRQIDRAVDGAAERFHRVADDTEADLLSERREMGCARAEVRAGMAESELQRLSHDDPLRRFLDTP